VTTGVSRRGFALRKAPPRPGRGSARRGGRRSDRRRLGRMGQQEIKQALDGAIEYLTNNRQDAKYTDSPATARLKSPDALAVHVTGPESARLDTDMPTSVGGGNGAPSPGWFLRAAEASCVATMIGMRAAQLSIPLQDVEVVVDSESDDYGILGLADDVPAGPVSTRISVRITAKEVNGNPTSSSDLQDLVEWAVAHCPVVDAVRRSVPVSLEVTTA
jgi:uncharacterized OsmC-like protein